MTPTAPVSDELLASLEDQYRGIEVDAALLAHLRRRLDRSELAYAEPPKPILGGTESWIFGFRLAHAPGGWDAPLVLRLARDDRSLDLRFEGAVQNAVASQGFSAPRVLAVDDEGGELGRPFLVMERLPGAAGPGGLFQRRDAGPGALLLAVPRLVTLLPRLQARALLQLHALDPEPLLAGLDAAGVPRERIRLETRLEQLEADADELRHPGLTALVHWLRVKRPPEPGRPSICHGDFHAFNLLFEPGRLSGVIDWTSVRVADPALDLGVVRAQLQISQLPVARIPGPLVHAVQMRVLRAFEREYARTRPVATRLLAYYEMLPCASAVARMLRYGSHPDREPLVELAWEHPRAFRRLVRRVFATSGVRLDLEPRREG